MKNKNSPGASEGKDKWKKFTEEQSTEATMEAPEGLVHEDDLGLEFPDRKKLEEQLTHTEQQIDELKDKNLRLLAQLKNIQERADRDVSNAHRYGAEKLLNDLLPIVDSLERSLENCSLEAAGGVREGLQLTLDLLIKTLKKHGVEIIAPQVGERFNPEKQEAVSMQPEAKAEPNTVITTIQKGYALNGRVIRAAMVVVAG
ncbi:MAG: nucleotide exchange factor GrpE [Coxiella sp. RIFCSPHIGHO2_12_FULL_42_15]|nr:MAG: nucleotide exchange factor GrpE [Coxiella sp. RIFCSPHIGHO2_12_FULL_42_15]